MKKRSNLKELMMYAGKRRFLTYASWVFSALSAVCGVMPFVFIFFIIKEVVEVAPDFSLATGIIRNGWLAVIFSVATIFVYVCGLMCSHMAAFRVASNIKKKTMKHISMLPIGYVGEYGSGKLRRIVNESSGATENYLAHNLPDMVQAIFTPIIMIVLLFVFDWRFGLVSLIPFIFGFIAMSKMAGPAMAHDMELFNNAVADMNNEAVEYVRGVPVVKTFGQTVFSFKKFKGSIDNYYNFCISYTKRMRKPMLLYTTFINSGFAFLIGLALILAKGEAIGQNLFLNFVFYVIFTPAIVTALTKIMYLSENGMIVNDALNRIHSIIDLKPLEESKNPKKILDNSIEFENVNFKYSNSSNNALSNVSFKVDSGATVAFVGPSGGGKTTIAGLINRFWDVNSGVIKIGKVDVKDLAKEDLMNNISYVFQDSKLLKMSILDNVKLANPEASKEMVLEALHKAQCDDIIEKMPNGIDTIIGTKGVYLSGGEQQRICIARVILKNAPIVILDEATAYADPENEVLVQRAFDELAKNKTVIMIAHRLSTVINANKIFVVKDGKIVEEGNHNSLLSAKGLYSKMWNEYQTAVKWKVGDSK